MAARTKRLMIEKVNEKVVEQGSMLVIHFNGLCIVVLIACYVRLTHLMRVGTDIDRLGALIAFTVLPATALLATVRERLSAAEALQLRLVGRGQPPARLAEVQMAHAYLEAMHSALERAIDWANSVATARTELR